MFRLNIFLFLHSTEIRNDNTETKDIQINLSTILLKALILHFHELDSSLKFIKALISIQKIDKASRIIH